MNILNISSDPVTKLARKLKYKFLWDTIECKIIIKCFVSHYDESGNHIVKAGTKDFYKDLIASDSLVRISDGHILTDEEKAADGFDIGSPLYTTEYNYYVAYIGSNPIILPSLIEGIIMLRDSEGKFNI